MKLVFFCTMVFLLFIFSKPTQKKVLQTNDIEIISTNLPIKLDAINFNDSLNYFSISDGKLNEIEQLIHDFYFKECKGDLNETLFSKKDVHFKTLRFSSDSYIGFWIILIQKPLRFLRSKFIFIEIGNHEIIGQPFDFKINSLYNFENKNILPSNLKTHFNIDSPEIKLVDFDKNGKQDFMLTRLFHNGTSNAIEELILSPNTLTNKIDTLFFHREWL